MRQKTGEDIRQETGDSKYLVYLDKRQEIGGRRR